MKLSNVVVMCLSALLGLLMVCFTAIACTMVVNWSAPEEAAILEGKVCSVQAFNSDYEVDPLADNSAPAFADMDANAAFDLVIDGTPDVSSPLGVWFFPAVLPQIDSSLLGVHYLTFHYFGSSYTYTKFDGGNSVLIYDDNDYSMFKVYDSIAAPLGWYGVEVRLVYIRASLPTGTADSLAFLQALSAVKVSDSLDYEPVVAVDEPEEPEKGSMVSQVTDVFEGLGVWIADNFGNVMLVFYDTSTSQLTLLGILAAAALVVSVFFLLMGIIQNFLHFRG